MCYILLRRFHSVLLLFLWEGQQKIISSLNVMHFIHGILSHKCCIVEACFSELHTPREKNQAFTKVPYFLDGVNRTKWNLVHLAIPWGNDQTINIFIFYFSFSNIEAKAQSVVEKVVIEVYSTLYFWKRKAFLFLEQYMYTVQCSGLLIRPLLIWGGLLFKGVS